MKSTASSEDGGMFDSLTAWFSDSVYQNRREAWVNYGGIDTGIEDAQFIFSENPAADDTKHLFESQPYLYEHLAVFHAAYIDECIRKGGKEFVTIGHYFLPSEALYKATRHQAKYCFDSYMENKENDTSVRRPHRRKHESSKADSSRHLAGKHPDFISIDDLSLAQGVLEDFRHGEKGCIVKKIKY